MGKVDGKCLICGASPTVKAHIFPRALMLDLREDGKSLYETSVSKPGHSFPQNGPWDDSFLCKRHEDLAGAGDDYAVQFWRLAERKLQSRAARIEVPNPSPHSLAKFAYGVLWRHVNAPINQRLKLSLGPFEDVLRETLFDGGEPQIDVLIGVSPLTIGGKPAGLGIPPYRRKIGHWNSWHFVLGRLDVHLKLDSRPFPDAWREYTAGEADPIVLLPPSDLDAHRAPFLRDLLAKMRGRPS